MQITIIGCGKVGLSLAGQLQSEGNNVVVVDKNERVVDQVRNTLDVQGFVGNGAAYPVLKMVKVESCDLLIAVTASDEVNMLCCLAAHKLGAKHTIARVRNPEYADQLYALKDDLGLSMALNPEREAAREIARILLFPSATRVELFAHGRAELVSCRVPRGSVLKDLKLAELPQQLRIKVLICAVERDDEFSIPSGDFTLREGDNIYFTGSPKEIERAVRRMGMLAHPVRSAMIAGGGRITYYLAQALEGTGISVKIIEQDSVRAQELAEQLPEAVVLAGDAADHELLGEEGLDKSDAFVSLTGLDEGNILSAIYAKKRKVSKVIAKVNNDHLAALVKDSGLDTIISPKLITINQILRYVRSTASRGAGSKVNALYKLAGGRVELSEFIAEEDERLINIPLRSLQLKRNIIIACIVRNRVAIIPGGADRILPGDSVLVVTADQRMSELCDILEAQR